MKVIRYTEMPRYEAAHHDGMHCRRVQGHDVSPAQLGWQGLSWLLPGGRTSLAASTVEKLYLVLAGEVTIGDGREEAVLRPYDSCYLAPGESRQLRNDSALPAAILLTMPYETRVSPKE
ncbi:hypothetical protein BTH42_07610 [Burkholderia sp. SRS-W-2-2016]|uniref:cupin domain-containing protein n=1 Tax=Burkholderia sp. SRS-W-2-2016 TaxID=1926878 RepID=UPI00094B2BEA|nr:cupin domain-containing protein [Burkholderia sp. SRS-W-2-2016]OLL32304.1 hypothetical protein BTH42_07610 [Burkholderia sp. SRS-W-2-2016]